MNRYIVRLAGVGFAFWIVACGSGEAPLVTSPIDLSNPTEAWNANNDPRRLKGVFEVRLNRLPWSATVERKPWSDTYWPSYRGGLANRWQEPTTNPFGYGSPDLATLRTLSPSVLKRLSPAEKYDIFVGRYDYPLVKMERQRTHPDEPTWHGICHGWSPAAINFAEPKPTTLTGANGIEVPFGSSDVKALLSFVQQYRRPASDSRMLGGRCDINLSTSPDHAGDAQCRDTNAGAFHILLANQLAFLKQPFVADVTRDEEIWNQPVYGYKSQVLGEVPVYRAAAPGTTRIMKVKTRMEYVVEFGPNWRSVPAAEYPQQLTSQEYVYTLELNDEGEIIGGEWLTYKRPDFLWTQDAPKFTGYFSAVEQIYKASQQQ